MLLLPEELEKLIKYRLDYNKSTRTDIVHMYFKEKGWFGRDKIVVETYKLVRRTSTDGEQIYYHMRDEFSTLLNQLHEYVKLRFEGYKLSKFDVSDWMDYQLEKQVLGELDESRDK